MITVVHSSDILHFMLFCEGLHAYSRITKIVVLRIGLFFTIRVEARKKKIKEEPQTLT
jgi:hypothetical protein